MSYSPVELRRLQHLVLRCDAIVVVQVVPVLLPHVPALAALVLLQDALPPVDLASELPDEPPEFAHNSLAETQSGFLTDRKPCLCRPETEDA